MDRTHRKGLYRIGLQEPETYIGNHREKLLEVNLTDSEMKVILATSENEEEQLVLKNYLDIRQTYGKNPMTDARQRAAVTLGYVVDGIISDSRGSFVSR